MEISYSHRYSHTTTTREQVSMGPVGVNLDLRVLYRYHVIKAHVYLSYLNVSSLLHQVRRKKYRHFTFLVTEMKEIVAIQ